MSAVRPRFIPQGNAVLNAESLNNDLDILSKQYRDSDVLEQSLSDKSKMLKSHQLKQNQQWRDTEEALKYLRKYGYIEHGHESKRRLKDSIKSFQQMVGLRETGKLNHETIERMRLPRCGNEDGPIMREVREGHRHSKRFVQVSRWTDKINKDELLPLKWFVSRYTKDIPEENLHSIIEESFNVWSTQVGIPTSKVLKLAFSEAPSKSDADIDILWAEGQHGDTYPFDGAGNSSNVLAHTFYPNYKENDPLNGDMHFDDFEKWTLDPNDTTTSSTESDNGVYLPYVLVHEIGHALGLGHSMRQEAIMNPIYRRTPLDKIKLDIDDQCAANWNYVGPSSICIFVWLMVEYSPAISNSNLSSSPATFTASTKNEDGNVGEMRLQSSMSQTLDNIEASKIPRCHRHNNHESQFVNALIKKLSFPLETAKKYAPIICNYMQGLYDVVKQRRRKNTSIGENSKDQAPDTAESISLAYSTNIDQLRVHNYMSHPRSYSATEFEQRLSNSDDELQNSPDHYSADPQFSNNDFSNALTTDQRFDEAFFTNIIRLFLANSS